MAPKIIRGKINPEFGKFYQISEDRTAPYFNALYVGVARRSGRDYHRFYVSNNGRGAVYQQLVDALQAGTVRANPLAFACVKKASFPLTKSEEQEINRIIGLYIARLDNKP